MATVPTESRNYWTILFDELGEAWNRFWFTPGSAYPLSGLRILVGVLALYYVGSHSADLVRWYGRDGLLTTATVRQLTTPPTDDGSLPATFHWSYLNLLETPGELWGAHLVGMLVMALFAAGAWTRLTSVLATIVALSYVHRTPMLNAQFEAVLTMLLIYLSLGPCGAAWSLDAWRRKRTAKADGERSQSAEPADSILANISLKLIQIHVAGFYLLMGLTQLGGAYGVENSATWWRGEALWWLIAKSESRVLDFTFLNTVTAGYVINAWTHAIVFGELAFGLLIWKPNARPLLLVLAALGWLSLAPVTGLVSYSAMMLVANLAFLSPDAWRCIARRVGLASHSTYDRPPCLSA